MAHNRTTRLTAICFHRNGVGGHGFHAIAFRDLVDGGWRNLIATVFDAGEMEEGEVHPPTGMVTVLDADLAARGVVSCPENTWRGDHYEPQLRQWVAQHQVELKARLDAIDRALEAAKGPLDPAA
jgi:hypothetical protein